MIETIFLICLGLIWIIFAVVQDLRKREIANWLNFSLIIFALGFRFFYSLFGDAGYGLFYQGLLGFGVFFLLGNLMYLYPLEYSSYLGMDVFLLVASVTLVSGVKNYIETIDKLSFRKPDYIVTYRYLTLVNFILESFMFYNITLYIDYPNIFIQNNPNLLTVFVLTKLMLFLDYFLYQSDPDFDLHLMLYNIFNPVYYMLLGSIIKLVAMN